MNSKIAFRLKDRVGIDPIRPSAYMSASMVRATSKMFVDFEWMRKSLKECVEQGLILCALNSSTIVPLVKIVMPLHESSQCVESQLERSVQMCQ